MRQHKSVFVMLVRSSFYKVCGLLGIMIIAESLFFYRRLSMAAMDVSYGGTMGYGLETLIDRSWLPWIFGATFVLVTVILCYTGCEYGSRQGYTLRRLMITEKMVFWLQALYNCCCYVILWAAQIIVSGIFCLLYMKKTDAALLSSQTIFLAFYRNNFLHSILPLEEVNVWVRNLIVLIGLGILATGFPYKQRRKKHSAEIVALVGLVLVYFINEEKLTVIEVNEKGEYEQQFTVVYSDEENPLYYPTYNDVMDWNGEKLAIARYQTPGSYYSKEANDFYLAVYDESGMIYYGSYESSLSTGESFNDYQYYCRPVDYNPLNIVWS